MDETLTTTKQEVVTPPAPNSRAPRRLRLHNLAQRGGALSALIIIMIASGLISPQFFTMVNLLNVMQQIAIVGVLGVGMTYVILTAGIDLSVGSIVAMVSVFGAISVNANGLVVGIAESLILGAIVGVVNGAGVVLARIQPFIMTLATMATASGVAFILSGGLQVSISSNSFNNLGQGRVAGLPIPAVVLIVLALLGGFVLSRTVFGRSIFAVGSNREAARLSGISVGWVQFTMYVVSGVCAALGGLLYSAELGTGTPTAGTGIELDAIAAVVIGGTSLFGGVGGISGTFIGAAILGILADILNLVGVQTYVQDVVKGAIIVVAILVQNLSGRAGRNA
jgi:ribose/xylose/arabinose/galactoside ABC-type transport system permease subunit